MEPLQIINHRPSRLTDQEVVAQVLGGNKGLYEILLRRYNQTLYRVIRSYLHHDADVEDALQETYLKAYLKLDQYRSDSAFSTWLIRIGINEALQRIRTTKRRLHHITEDNGEQAEQLPDTQRMNPENKAIHEQTRVIVESAIDRLPADHRAVYMLREVEGLSSAEASACLGISEGNVKVRLHRAKAALKENIATQLSDVPVFEFGNARCDRIVAAVMSKI